MTPKPKTKKLPLEPTVEMFIAGRKQCMNDMVSTDMGPNIENIWKAMAKAYKETK